MKTLIIVTHPNLTASRINKAWLEELRKHSELTIHELAQSYPDEVIDVAREQKLIEAHDRIILQFPMFWYSTPSLLKKWFDNVLEYGWAYGPDTTVMPGKEFGVAVSTYGSTASYQPGGANRFTLQEILRPIEATIYFMGATYLPHFTLNDAPNVTDEQLEQSKKAYVAYIKSESK
ncbi:NAD(P)H-dependent oxidoreductase [Paenibacillus sp. R14(2021)]|uniref:NAD(P)H-dependent oxidoreductase n=1 Tax=Paenibacillus sp. R14(2021) TaxID=2859228 RepID=UPI001C611BD2|nr:NAD(P)H-dependent oxidoreductase [Paenibacillus sp. R14(2021)]